MKKWNVSLETYRGKEAVEARSFGAVAETEKEAIALARAGAERSGWRIKRVLWAKERARPQSARDVGSALAGRGNNSKWR